MNNNKIIAFIQIDLNDLTLLSLTKKSRSSLFDLSKRKMFLSKANNYFLHFPYGRKIALSLFKYFKGISALRRLSYLRNTIKLLHEQRYISNVIVAVPKRAYGYILYILARLKLIQGDIYLGDRHPFMRLLEYDDKYNKVDIYIRLKNILIGDSLEIDQFIINHLNSGADLSIVYEPDESYVPCQIIDRSSILRIKDIIRQEYSDKNVQKNYFIDHYDYPYYLDKNIIINLLDKEKYISIAPPYHKTSLYRDIIRKVSDDSKCIFVTAEQVFQDNLSKNHINVVVRHDIDYYPEKTKLLTDIDKEFNIQSIIYVLVNNIYYEIEKWADYFTDLKKDGFAIGLHSSAYCYNDMKGHFLWETERFKQIFGFHPKYVSRHGQYPRPPHYETRNIKYIRTVSRMLKKLNYTGFDFNLNAFRITDGGFAINPPFKTVSLIKKFQIDNYHKLKPGNLIIMNFHPDHWQNI